MFSIIKDLYLRELLLFLPEFVAELLRHIRDRFDEQNGVDTNNYLSIGLLGVSEGKAKLSEMYWPTRQRPFDCIMQSLNIRYQDFTFVDLGSGKGRTLFMAAQYQFKKLIGVDFSPKLHEVAEKNHASFCRKTGTPESQFQFLLQDATEFVFPDGPVVVFLFDPFRAEIMEKVVANMLASVKENPREFFVAYYLPINNYIFKRPGFEKVAVQNRNWKLDYPWVIYKLNVDPAVAKLAAS